MRTPAAAGPPPALCAGTRDSSSDAESRVNPPEHRIAQPPEHQLAVADLGHALGVDADDTAAAVHALADRRASPSATPCDSSSLSFWFVRSEAGILVSTGMPPLCRRRQPASLGFESKQECIPVSLSSNSTTSLRRGKLDDERVLAGQHVRSSAQRLFPVRRKEDEASVLGDIGPRLVPERPTRRHLSPMVRESPDG